ncbi:MAG: trigger factor [Synergistaceae bacterium]
MKSELISQEQNIVTVKAEFDSEEVKGAILKTYKELSKKANIKGFRKGHIPAKTLELYFGKQTIFAETMELIIPDALDTIVDEYELRLIKEPDLKPGEMEEGKPFEFTAIFEIFPEVTFPEIETIEAEKTIYLPTDEMVEENIVKLLDAHSEVVPTYEERPLTKEDYVSVKYSSNMVDENSNVTVIEEDKKTEINLGLDEMKNEIVDALVGKNLGETVTVDFPVDKDNKELSGKGMRYIIEILGIMKKETPSLSDETVLKITQGQNKTVDEFRTEVSNQLKKSAERQSEETLKNSAVSKIVELSEIELPQSIVDRQIEAMKEDQVRRIQKESGMTLDEFFEKTGMDKEKYEAELKESAEKIVKRGLVLEAIAEANDIQWTRDEIDSEISTMAISSNIDLKKARDFIYSDRDRVYEIAEKIRNRKTVDFIVSKVKVIEVENKKTEEE